MRLNACRDIGTRVSTNIELNNKKRKEENKKTFTQKVHTYTAMLMNFHFIGKNKFCLECEDNFGSLRVWIFTTLMKVGSPYVPAE